MLDAFLRMISIYGRIERCFCSCYLWFRAANGVVIRYHQERGGGSKPTVNFNYNVTTDVQIKNFRILYGDEWRETVRRFAKETLVYDPSNNMH